MCNNTKGNLDCARHYGMNSTVCEECSDALGELAMIEVLFDELVNTSSEFNSRMDKMFNDIVNKAKGVSND